MAFIVNEWGGDFQQGGCLYKQTGGIQWTPEHALVEVGQASESSLRIIIPVKYWQWACYGN